MSSTKLKPFKIVDRTKEIEQLLTGPTLRESLIDTLRTKKAVFVANETRSIGGFRSEVYKLAKTHGAHGQVAKGEGGYFAWLSPRRGQGAQHQRVADRIIETPQVAEQPEVVQHAG